MTVSAGFPLSSAAQTESAIEEILVTAQKRTESLQDVPISLSVVQGSQIQQMGIRNLSEVALATPNFHISSSPGQSGIYMRSIGSGTNNQGFEQSVGLFVDGIYASRPRLVGQPFMDVARIEVIKGPQNVVLGKNTTAGAISIVTAKPTNKLEAMLSGLYGSDGEYGVNGVMSGPLNDAVKARLAVRASGLDGFLDNTFSSTEDPETEESAARGTLVFEPNENIEITLKGELSRSRIKGMSVVASQLTDAQLALARSYDSRFSLDLDDKQRSTDAAGILGSDSEYLDTDAHLVSLNIDWNIGDWVLTSLTGWAGYEYSQGTDIDFTPIGIASLGLLMGSEYEQLSEELRLQSPLGRTLEFLGGLYLQQSDIDYEDWEPCFIFANAPGPAEAAAFCTPQTFIQDQDTVSAFVLGTVNITDSLRVSAGVRYTHEEKTASGAVVVTELDGVTPDTDPLDLIAASIFGYVPHVKPPTKRKEDAWSPSINVQYDVTSDVMLYASFAEGTKGGGFNALEGSGNLDEFEFEEEEARSLEFGAKAQFLDRRLTTNVAVFLSQFDDLQVSQFNGFTFVVNNAEQADVNGVEGDFAWQLTDRLALSSSVAYLDSTYDRFTTAGCKSGQTPAEGCINGVQDLSGADLAYAPEWSASLGADYEWSIGDRLTGTAHFDVAYRDDQILGPDDDIRTLQDAYATVNLRLGLGAESGAWEVALIGKNVGDEIAKNYENDIPGFPGGFFAGVTRGRSYAVQGTVRF